MSRDWTIDTFDALTAADRPDSTARTVLVLTDTLEGVSEVGETLIALGYRVQVAMAHEGQVRGMPSGTPDALLVCLDALLDEAESLLRAVRRHLAAPLVPIIGYLAPHATRPDGFDSVLVRPAHPRQIAGRVDAMIRLQAMEHEFLRRTQVLRAGFGIAHELAPDALTRPLRVLFIGKAKPEFMVVLNALRARKAEVVAAFTSFTAFDYLHGREFDAVIVDAMQSTEPATSILGSMTRNVRLFHVPKILMVRDDGGSALPAETRALATDVICATRDTHEITGRILEPANYHCVHSQLRAEFGGLTGEGVRDPDTGLYNADYLEAYLGFLATEGETRTLITVRLTPQSDDAVPEDFVRVAFAQAGGLLAGLVRINDLVARVGYDSFAVALEPIAPQHLAGLCDRIADVIECAAFESGLGREQCGPFTLSVDISTDDDDQPTLRVA